MLTSQVKPKFDLFKISLPLLFLSLICGPLSLLADETDTLWIEGEAPSRGQGYPHPWYSGQVQKGALSGGGWLSSFTDKADTEVAYEVQVPKDGDWSLWARLNPTQSKASWKLNDAAWTAIDMDNATDRINIASDGKPDLRFVAWVKLGKFPLTAGKATLAFKLHSDNNHHGGLDCFLLTIKPFTPNGKAKPGMTLNTAEPGWFAFEPPVDEFSKDALLDLRGLNERRAGEKGFVRAQGDDFVDGAGNPIRFWAANAGPAKDPDGADYLAARLAKNGVNLARLHGGWFDRTGNDPKALNPAHADKCFRQIQAFADQGIYVHLSIYFPLWLQLKASDGIADCALGKKPMGLLLFEPTFQSHWKAWAKAVLTTKNPYTGKTLAEDPAVAFFEIQNEDSFFFWTFQPEGFGPGPYRQLCQRFGDWAAKRHGSLNAALAAWKGETHPSDGEGRLGLYKAWDMTSDGFSKSSPGKQARATDQIRFLAGLQRQTYAELAGFLRKECGFKGVISASNWTTADNRRLGMIERWTYTVTDCIDRHGYFGGKHQGEAAGYMLRTGHTFTDKAAVLDPTTALTGYLQLAGKPHINTEVMWDAPNRLIADGPLLLSSYSALQGVDGIFSFATHSGTWDTAGTSKWPMMRPGWLGQFPATALQYRRGDLKPAPTVLRQVVSVDDLFAFKGSGFVEGPNTDFRLNEAPKASEAGRDDAFDPYSYCVGRVERVIGGPGKPESADLSKFIDHANKVVTSVTGELRWDWGNGLVTVNSPKSQAVSGYLAKAGPARLRDVTISCRNDYGTVHVISLDGLPLASSRKMLVQAFTEQKLYGWKAANGRILDVGQAPINVKDVSASVTFANPAGLKAVVLDGNGMKRGDLTMVDGVLTLPRDALYTILTR